MSQTLSGAITGATAGAALGPIGAAVGGLLGAAPGLLSALGVHIFDEPTAMAALGLVRKITGTDAPSAADMAGLSPDQRVTLETQLAKIAADRDAATRAAENAALAASFADTASARQQMQNLAAAHSGLAYGPAVISAIVILGFIGLTWLSYSYEIPKGAERSIDEIRMTFRDAFIATVAFWIGSNASGRAKDATVAVLASLRGGSPG